MKLTKTQIDGLKALASCARPYPFTDRTMRALLRQDLAEYDRARAEWKITTAGRTALSEAEDRQ